jgi:hypothetical protein
MGIQNLSCCETISNYKNKFIIWLTVFLSYYQQHNSKSTEEHTIEVINLSHLGAGDLSLLLL